MENFKIVVKDKSRASDVLNFIEDMRKFFQLEERLKYGSVGDVEIYCKCTPAFAEVIRLHEDVTSVQALL